MWFVYYQSTLNYLDIISTNKLDDAGSISQYLLLLFEPIASLAWKCHGPDIPIENSKKYSAIVSHLNSSPQRKLDTHIPMPTRA
jgi:hypothetical protein